MCVFVTGRGTFDWDIEQSVVLSSLSMPVLLELGGELPVLRIFSLLSAFYKHGIFISQVFESTWQRIY